MDGIEANRVLSAGHALLDTLSACEREVLTEVAGDWPNAEIAERLHIFAATAKTHVRPADDDEAGRARPGSAGHARPRDKSGHSR